MRELKWIVFPLISFSFLYFNSLLSIKTELKKKTDCVL